MGATTGGSAGPDPPKFGKTPKFSRSFLMNECDYVTAVPNWVDLIFSVKKYPRPRKWTPNFQDAVAPLGLINAVFQQRLF